MANSFGGFVAWCAPTGAILKSDGSKPVKARGGFVCCVVFLHRSNSEVGRHTDSDAYDGGRGGHYRFVCAGPPYVVPPRHLLLI